MKKSSIWLAIVPSLLLLGYALYNAFRASFTHPLDYALAAAALILLALLGWNVHLSVKLERMKK